MARADSIPVCNVCGLPNHDSVCPVCHLVRSGHSTEALELARALDFDCGPFCRFCESDEDTVLCDWPALRPAPIRISELQIGERIFPFERAREAYEVLQIRPPAHSYDYVTVKLKWPKGTGLYELNPERPVLIAVPGNCDHQACFRHSREVAEDRHYCADHWDAWKAVA